MRILFTGGGSGGHVFPIVAVRQSFNSIQSPDGSEFKFYYLGPKEFAEENLEIHGIKMGFIATGKIKRYFNPGAPFDFLKVVIGIIQSFFYLFFWMPDIIFSKGGYGSFPVVFVGRLYKIPIILHESDSAPGLANRAASGFATKIILSFAGSEANFEKYQKKLVLIGNPIRNELLQGDRTKGKDIFRIGSNKPVILVLGGSQGAQKINQSILHILPRILEIAEVIHVVGERNDKLVIQEAEKILSPYQNLKQFYHLAPFLNVEQLKHAYALSDLIINRAGAGSIFEIAALGKPSILIPLPDAASDHQRKNAYYFSRFGGTVILEQENLTPNIFFEEISKILNDPAKIQEMGQKAKSFYPLNIAERIREEIIKLGARKIG